MSVQRDRKRGACYNAENHAFEGSLLNENVSFDSLVTQTREIEATPEWQQICKQRINLGFNTGTRSWASSYANTISYTVSGSRRATVPHELAHIITPGDEGHGHAWRSAFVWVVRLAYGDEWADGLAESFRSSKLSFDRFPVIEGRVLPWPRTPVFPPALFDATHGTPLTTTETSAPRGPIAL